MSLLHESVLILNKYFMAVQVSIVKDSITALCNGKAEVVDEDYVTYNLQNWCSFTKSNKKDPEVLDKYAGILHSPSIEIFAPQVIRFPDCEYTSPLIKTVKYSRRNIYNRDRYICQYCNNERPEFLTSLAKGKKPSDLLNLDHVTPRAAGGQSNWENIVTSCRWCNSDKGDKSLDELGWQLLNPPKKPKWQSHVGVPFKRNKKKYWQRFS